MKQIIKYRYFIRNIIIIIFISVAIFDQFKEIPYLYDYAKLFKWNKTTNYKHHKDYTVYKIKRLDLLLNNFKNNLDENIMYGFVNDGANENEKRFNFAIFQQFLFPVIIQNNTDLDTIIGYFPITKSITNKDNPLYEKKFTIELQKDSIFIIRTEK